MVGWHGRASTVLRPFLGGALFLSACVLPFCSVLPATPPCSGVVAYADLPQLDRYTLGLLESHAAAVTAAYESYEFKEVFSLLLSFNATNLSAFVFELAKDRLYAEAPDSASRRAAQTVLLRALVVLTKSLAPIVPHFAEDVYQHVPAQLKQYFHSAAAAAPAAAAPATSATTETGAEAAGAAHDSLFMHGWLEDASSGGWSDPVLAGRVNAARRVRSHVTKLLERVRQEHKSIGNFSEAQVRARAHTLFSLARTAPWRGEGGFGGAVFFAAVVLVADRLSLSLCLSVLFSLSHCFVSVR